VFWVLTIYCIDVGVKFTMGPLREHLIVDFCTGGIPMNSIKHDLQTVADGLDDFVRVGGFLEAVGDVFAVD
jgi:hypothetical protein